MKTYLLKLRVVFLHALFWFGYVMIPYVVRPASNSDNLEESTRYWLWTIFFMSFALANIPLFYLNTEFLLKKVLPKFGWIIYLFCIVIAMYCMYQIHGFLLEKIHGPEVQQNIFRRGPIIGTTFQILFTLAMGVIYRFIISYVEEKEKTKELENERLKSELSFLRSQISPHFMFNVLNSIVALSRKKMEMVEPVVIKLSELMRYMIYETKDSKVSLEKESKYLGTYIELQKLRFGKDIEVSFEESIESPSIRIEPMLLIPFVENAFKHGVVLVENPFITISLKESKGILNFIVKNKISVSSKNEIKDESSGIGLANIKRRLELLHTEKFKLTMEEKNEIFEINLTIDLN